MGEINQNPPISQLAKELQDANLRSKAVAALERALFAENKIFDLKAKKMVTYDDCKTQTAAAVAILAYTDGKPVERREIIQRNITSLEDLRERAKKSPELRVAIAELLDEKPVAQVPNKKSQVVDNPSK